MSIQFQHERASLPRFSDQAYDGWDSHVRYEPLISHYFSGDTIIVWPDATWNLLRGIKQRYRPICGLTNVRFEDVVSDQVQAMIDITYVSLPIEGSSQCHMKT